MSDNSTIRLQFHPDGTFKIMQITDSQDSGETSGDTVALISAALDAEKPDFVVFTGDQVKGYAPKMRGKDAPEKVRQTISTLLAPVVERKIPFTITFGNHDRQSPVPLKDQLAIYQSFDGCLAYDTDGLPGCANHNIPIFSSDGLRTAFNLYCIDSHGSAGTGYAPVEKEQIEWYRQVRDRLCSENGGYVPSFIFQHIPVEEVFEVLKSVPKGTKGAITAYRKRKGQFYVLNEELCREGGFIGESAAVADINNGEFDAAAEKGDVLGIFFGHDHVNSFIGRYKGVDLGYTQGCGFSVYGPGLNRGVRVFNLNENDVRNYETHTLTFSNLVGGRGSSPLVRSLLDKTPTSFDAAVPFIAKILGIIAAIVAAIIILVKIL